MLLAVCIPTHDGRAAQLRAVLASLADGLADPRVEVCISDNASVDETAQVVEDFQKQIGDRVRYRRHDENRGFTANLLAAVELAEARWCWLLGSDDLVSPQGVAEVLALVERHPDAAGATFNRSLVDRRHPGVVLHDPPRLLPKRPDQERELCGEEAIVAELGHLHDYISTQVVDRELWLEATAEAGPEGLARGLSYPHLVVLTRMIHRVPRWTWYPGELVQQRVGASSIFDDRTEFDVAAYEAKLLIDRSSVWADLFGRWSPLHRTLLRKVWLRHFSMGVLLNNKLNPSFGGSSDRLFLRVLARHFWWMPTFWLFLPLLLMPGKALRGLRPLARGAKERLSPPLGG